MVVAAGVVATVGAFMQWYAPARALVFPDLSGVGLSDGVVLVATIGMAMLGLAIVFTGRVAAAVLAAVAATALLAAAFLTMQNVAALNQEPSGVHYALEIGLWITATAGVWVYSDPAPHSPWFAPERQMAQTAFPPSCFAPSIALRGGERRPTAFAARCYLRCYPDPQRGLPPKSPLRR